MHDRATEAPESVPPLTSMPPTALESRLIADRPAMTGGCEELIAFLSARLDDAETKARDLVRTAQDVRLALQDPRLLGRTIPGWHSWPDVEAMSEAAFREVATWRAILAQAAAGPPADRPGFRAGFSSALGFVLQAKAGEYSDHPDWRMDGCWAGRD